MQRPHPSEEMPVKYEWQQAYFNVMIETEDQLSAAIETAMRIIMTREQALLANGDDPEEQKAIADALANLRALKKGSR
jgi:hypothetical protein